MHDFEFIVRGVLLSIKISDMLFATYEFWIRELSRSFVRLSSKFVEGLLEMKPGKRAQVCLLS